MPDLSDEIIYRDVKDHPLIEVYGYDHHNVSMYISPEDSPSTNLVLSNKEAKQLIKLLTKATEENKKASK